MFSFEFLTDSSISDVDIICTVLGNLGGVRDHYDGRAISIKFLKETYHFISCLGVESTRGFVSEDEARFRDECSSNSNTLLLPSRELLWSLEEVFTESDPLESFLGSGSALSHSDTMIGEWEHHLVDHIHTRDERIVLEYKSDLSTAYIRLLTI